jgi:polysaccharide biosynthesis/export protein
VLIFLFASCTANLLSQSTNDSSLNPAISPAGFPAAVPETSSDFSPTKKHQPPESSFTLGPGDLLEVSVYGVPELTTKARIANNGDVYLPLVDYVHVAGLSLDQAQAVLEKRLSTGGFVNDPHVTLFVDEYASQRVSLLGEIAKPGQYPMLGEQRLWDVISAAGGFTEKAGRSITITRKANPESPVTVALSRNITGNPAANVEVLPGDVIVVQKADIVYVVGDVQRPSGLFLDSENLTVLKAVALAGGANRSAKLNGTKIIRKTSQGLTELPVPLKKIFAAKSQDIAMQPDDILFIPTGTAKLAAGHVAQAALQSAMGVAIFAARP